MVFVGANQVKIPFELVNSMQALGDSGQYIKINSTGPNALDFHIAFYIGRIAEKDHNAYFHIISKDTGFDPLIKHLRDNKMLAQRISDIEEIIQPQPVKQESPNTQLKLIITRLNTMQSHKPKTLQGLENTISSVFSQQLNKSELSELIQHMRSKKLINTQGEKIVYCF